MIRIEGYISKRNIRRWLNNYQALAAGDYSLDDIPRSSGPKADDGVSGARLNKIMLDQAVAELPQELKTCVYARWVYCLPLAEALPKLGLEKAAYYSRCDRAVDRIYQRINGGLAGAKALLGKILGT